ncbi:MAG TPA: hypothetical protein VGD99_00880 [Anaerolineae bacterium]|jgi:hypothetical protein
MTETSKQAQMFSESGWVEAGTIDLAENPSRAADRKIIPLKSTG